MQKDIYLAATFALACAFTNNASSADLCKALALQDVPSVEDPSSILHKGETDDSVTQYRVDKKTGEAVFCSHGGYCYPAHTLVNGKKVEAFRLINCKVGKKEPEPFGLKGETDYYYGVDVVRSMNSPDALRLDDLENKLLEIGLCSACADNVAQYYINKPTSPCAQLAKQALEGNPDAVDKLRNDPSNCKWNYEWPTLKDEHTGHVSTQAHQDIRAASDGATKAAWNETDVDASTNGNIATAAEIMRRTNVTVNQQPSHVLPSLIMTAPWKYYGQMQCYLGEVSMIRGYPDGSAVSKLIGGGDASEVVIMVGDGTILDFVLFGDAESKEIAGNIYVCGLPVGRVEVDNQLGGKTSQLMMIGRAVAIPTR